MSNKVDSRLPYMTIKGYVEEAKTTYNAVYGKIRTEKWKEGREYFYDPDGRIWIILEGVNSWLTQGVSGRTVTASKSRSSGEAKGTDLRGHIKQRLETSKRQVAYALI